MEAANKARFNTLEEYFSAFPKYIRDLLESVRKTIHQAAPQAEELISYNMPAFRQKGILVFFAAWKEHIGFYPTPSGIEAFRQELSGYEISKGAIQFPINKPLPLGLVSKIVKFRVKENEEKAKTKLKKNK